jgi:uroporphyrinogen III methyltransferase/synthase
MGTVYLVGAGPGDPSLITVRGLELLQRADVVLYDRLVSPALLERVRPRALLVDVGKSAFGDAARQADINRALVDYALEGRVVVRLKGGDPNVFGRAWEERQACAASGVPCEIVPGVSSALAGPASAGIPLTLRGVASSIGIAATPAIGDQELRTFAGADTAVFLMGVRELPRLVRRLSDAGRDPSTPVAIVERATMPGQRVIRSTLGGIVSAAERAGIESPAVIIVGATAALGAKTYGPLAGKRVVVTRPVNAAHELSNDLRALGADVVFAPLIEIVPVEHVDAQPLDRLADYDWIVFTSRHAVTGFRRLVERRRDVRSIAHARFGVVGPTAGRELEAWGIQPDLQPAEHRADRLAALLAAQGPRRVLFPCGTLALTAIPAVLGEHGIPVDLLPVYHTRRLPLDERARAQIECGVDAVLLASPSAAAALGASGVELGDATVGCIGPTTAAAAVPFGWPNVVVASDHSDGGMIEALLHVELSRGGGVQRPSASHRSLSCVPAPYSLSPRLPQ